MGSQRPKSRGLGPERWRRLEPLLDQWLDCVDESARAALLGSVRAEAPELLPDFEATLRSLAEDSDALELPLADAVPDLLSDVAKAVSVDPARRGQRLGPYRLLEVLDRGGMGVVYLAERADGQYQQRVAVKLLPAGLESPEAERRFLTERQILARLEHPHVARLLDGGVTGEGFPYLVMELVEGLPIDVHCEREGLGLERRLELFLQVCDAVQHAHRHMVVHRDLKPSNILVSAAGEVKLLDFGIAKLEDPAFAAAGAPTTVFQPRSVPYASPEQLAHGSVSAASDVYSLGVVLYELLAGAAPYELGGLSPSEVESTVRERAPEPPSARAGSSARGRRLAGDLDNIVLKALRKDPSRRYLSAVELAEDLRRFLAGRPVRARPNTRRYLLFKFVGRHRVGVAVAAAVVLILAAGMLVIVKQSRRAAIERDRAERAAELVLDFMTIPDPDRGGGTTITSRELLDQARLRVSRELETQPEMQVRILSVIAEGYFNLGVYEVAAEIQRGLIERLRSTDDPQRLIDAYLSLGLALASHAKGEEAIPVLEEAIDLARREHGEESLEFASALGALARGIAVGLPPSHPEFSRLEPLLTRAIEIHRRLDEGDDRELAAQLHLLGQVEFSRAFAEPARREELAERGEGTMREALAMRRRLFGDRGFPVAETLNDLGLAIDGQGRAAEAMPMLQEALEIHREVLGEDHPDSLHMLNNVAAMYRDAGMYAQAEPLYRRCLEHWRNVHPEDSLQMWAPIYGLARVLLGLGDLDGAEEQVERLLAVTVDPADTRVQLALGVKGEIETQRGRFQAAERLLLSSHDQLARLYPLSHPDNVRARRRLVDLYESWGRGELADAYRETPERRDEAAL